MNPKAKKIPHEITTHGHSRIDNYYWLREKENPEVIDYLNAQNKHTEESMADTKGLQEELYLEMRGRIKETDVSAPVRRADYEYYHKTFEGKQYPSYWRKPIDSEQEELLLDLNELAKDFDYLRLGILKMSPNHKLLAYSLDTNGYENYTVYIKDLATNTLLDDRIEKTNYSLEWADNNNFYYTVNGEAMRSDRVFKHQLGDKQADDIEAFHEENELFSVNVRRTKDSRYLIIQSDSIESSEAFVLNLRKQSLGFKIIQKRVKGLEYFSISHRDGKFYIVNNDNAKNFKVSVVDSQNPSKENWQDFIAHRDDVKIDDIEVFKDYMAISERKNGLQALESYNFASKKLSEIEFPEAVYAIRPEPNPIFESKKLRINYTSPTTPASVYEIDLESGNWQLIKETEVLGGFDKNNYQSERIFASGHDGVKIPMSIVYKKDLFKKDGSNPALLYGYGSYGYSIDPGFSSMFLSLIDRGFVLAYAHIRGSSTMGRSWYEDGKYLKKKNTFLDFISCAKTLIKENYTAPDKLAIEGRSAGGLLMGATLNMAPELFRAAIAGVPFVDVVTTMLDESLPLTVGEFEEWGNPKDKDYYDYMLSYSPYDNVEAKDYPNILITGGLNDPRVHYWEPAKWAAKLLELKTDNNKLLLKTNMGAGHGGASGRYDYLKERAFEFAFLLDSIDT